MIFDFWFTIKGLKTIIDPQCKEKYMDGKPQVLFSEAVKHSMNNKISLSIYNHNLKLSNNNEFYVSAYIGLCGFIDFLNDDANDQEN